MTGLGDAQTGFSLFAGESGDDCVFRDKSAGVNANEILSEAQAALEAHAREIEAYMALLEKAEARVATLTQTLELIASHDEEVICPRCTEIIQHDAECGTLARDALAGTKGGAE